MDMNLGAPIQSSPLAWVLLAAVETLPCLPLPSASGTHLQWGRHTPPFCLAPGTLPPRPPLPSWVLQPAQRACGRRALKAELQCEKKESADLKLEALTDVALFNAAPGLWALVGSQRVCQCAFSSKG